MDDNLVVSETTRVCDQCKRDVAEANFKLHVSHCRRFLSLCPDCDEPVPRELLEQHKLEQHMQVACSKCNKKIEHCHLQDHDEEECVERLVSCEFCELEVPWSGLADHTGPCGSRTEKCRDCGRYVTLRNQQQHAHTCAAASGPEPSRPEPSEPEPTRPEPTRQKPSGPETTRPKSSRPETTRPEPTRRISTRPEPTRRKSSRPELSGPEPSRPEPTRPEPWALLEHHSKTWLQNYDKEEEEEEDEEEDYLWHSDPSPGLSQSLKAVTFVGRAWRDSGACGGRDPDQISTCPYCHLALPLFTLRWHQRKCQIHINLK